MTAELWLRKPCQHGNLRCFVKTPLNDNLDPPLRTCPGGSEERLDPFVIPDRQRVRETVELWHENGLTAEFLEGMSYNHRVALVAAADAFNAIIDALGATDE